MPSIEEKVLLLVSVYEPNASVVELKFGKADPKSELTTCSDAPQPHAEKRELSLLVERADVASFIGANEVLSCPEDAEVLVSADEKRLKIQLNIFFRFLAASLYGPQQSGALCWSNYT